MKRPRRKQGFILMATLLVSVLILLLGFAMSSMATTNLRTSGNRMSRIEAKYAAESGIDIAMAQLQQMDADAARTYYAVPVSKNCPGGADCTVTVKYVQTIDGGDVYSIESTGRGPKSAQYDSVALVLKGDGGSETNPWFSRGLVSEATVYVNGWTTIEDGDLHGNTGYQIHTGQFRADEVTASCPSDEIPASQCTCFAAGRNPYCNGNEPAEIVDPVDVGGISDHLDELWEEYDQPPPEDATVVNGPLVITSQSQLDDLSGSTIHVVGGDVTINVPGAEMYNVNLVLDDGYSVSFNQPATVTNSNIWAKDLTFLGHADISNSGFYLDGDLAFRGTSDTSDSVFVADGIDFHGTSDVSDTKLFSESDFDDHGAVTYSGETTLAVRGDIEFHGATDLSALDNEDGLAVIAEGDLTFSGRNDTVGVFWIGGNFRINGTKRIIGGVVSESDIDLNGRSYIKAQKLENEDLPQIDLLEGVYILSRGAVSED